MSLCFEAFREVFHGFLVEVVFDVDMYALGFYGLEERAEKPVIASVGACGGGVCKRSSVRVGGESGAHAGHGGSVVFVGFVVFEEVFIVRFEAGGDAFVAAEVFDCGFEEIGNFLHVLLVGGSAALFPLAPLLGADAESFCTELTAATAGEFLHPAISDVAGDYCTEGLRDSVHGWFPCRPKEKRRHCFGRWIDRYPDKEPKNSTTSTNAASKPRGRVRNVMLFLSLVPRHCLGFVDPKDFRMMKSVLEVTQRFCLYVLLIRKLYSFIILCFDGFGKWVFATVERFADMKGWGRGWRSVFSSFAPGLFMCFSSRKNTSPSLAKKKRFATLRSGVCPERFVDAAFGGILVWGGVAS